MIKISTNNAYLFNYEESKMSNCTKNFDHAPIGINFETNHSENESEIRILRNKFSEYINMGEQGANGIGDTMKLVNVGEVNELVSEALIELGMSNEQVEEPTWKTKLRQMIPFELANTLEKKARKSMIKGSTITEVTTKIIDAITTKREHIEKMSDGLFDLYDKIETSYIRIHTIRQDLEIRLEKEEFSEREEFHAKILLAEILEYQSIQQENLTSAKGAIESARVSVQQIAALQPKLRAQLNDGLSIRAPIEELNKLTTSCKAIETMCEGLRSENREKVAQAQLEAIERYTISDASLKSIQHSAKRQEQLIQQISSSREKMATSSQKKIDTLTEVVNRSHKTQIESSKLEISDLKAFNGVYKGSE